MREFDARARAYLQTLLDTKDGTDRAVLNRVLRDVAKWRSFLLANTAKAKSKGKIPSGPFAGMTYLMTTYKGTSAPHALGLYEASLAPVIEDIIVHGYDTIIDIGAAEGYYAIGLARRMPKTRIIARDIDPDMRENLQKMAIANDVADRVKIGGAIRPEEIGPLAQGKTLVLVDIEGAELDLIDLQKAPELRYMDMLIECHDHLHKGGVAPVLSQRLSETHLIKRLEQQFPHDALPDWAEWLTDLDRLLLLWEGRVARAPWLWARARKGPVPASQIKTRLDEIAVQFEAGNLTQTATALERLPIEQVPNALHGRYLFFLLGCALYGKGNLEVAREWNQRLPFSFHPALRYRFAMRVNDLQLARRIRAYPDHDDRVKSDFGWTNALQALWRGHHRLGMQRYFHRHNAINFPHCTPQGLTYAPYRGEDEQGLVFLEQGIGDFLFHIAHFQAITTRPDSFFFGAPRMQRFMQRYFPQTQFQSSLEVPDHLKGRIAHGSGDYMVQHFLTHGHFQPMIFDTPRAARIERYGICWRGGSGQNRREERRYPLDYFLDALPDGPQYVVLATDLSEEEKQIVANDRRVVVPDINLWGDVLDLWDFIATLAGVIAIDSANWHLAGLQGVPILALMNKTGHYYWGPNSDVTAAYPSATMLPKTQLARDKVRAWQKTARKAFGQRHAAPAHIKLDASPPPVLIVGAPRSGTSMTAGILATHGLWMGSTVKANRNNAKGYFENQALREQILKPSLAYAGADPLGISPLPALECLPPQPLLRRHVLANLRKQGMPDGQIWGFKDPKLTLLWPIWAEAFPDAHWVIVERDTDAIVTSCLNTDFMRRHDLDPQFWYDFVGRYRDRMNALVKSGLSVTRLSAEQIADGKFRRIKSLCKALGFEWSQKLAEDVVDPALLGRHGQDKNTQGTPAPHS